MQGVSEEVPCLEAEGASDVGDVGVVGGVGLMMIKQEGAK